MRTRSRRRLEQGGHVKALLRTVVVGVNLLRDGNGILGVRIVWRGGLVSEASFPVPMSSFRSSDRERQIVKRIRQAVDEGRDNAGIAVMLDREGFHPCREAYFTAGVG